MNAGQWHKEIYFVDKTSIVETFLSLGHKVHLISIPQGFLKTSNLRLLASFFDLTADPKVETNRRRVFQNTKIMSRAFIVAEYFGKFPTIFITFEHEKPYNILKMIEVFRQLYKHHDYLLSSSRVAPDEKRKFSEYLNYQPPTLGSNQQTQLADSVSFLCELLHKHHGKKVYVFVDNYDSPILSTISQNRPMYNFLPFLERMLNNIAACKSLNRLVLSGTTSISQLGTMKIDEFKFLAQHKYAKYFGFTERDLQELAIRCSAEVLEDLQKGCYCTSFNTKIYSPEWVLSRLNYAPIENPFWYEDILKRRVYRLPVLKTKIRLLVQGEDVRFSVSKYKSAKDLWVANKLLNGSETVQLEEDEISLLLSLFLEFGLFTFTQRRRRTGARFALSCLDNDPTPKLVLNNTSRGSEILKTQFRS